MAIVNIKPLLNMVVVKPIKKSEKSTGGILLPESNKEKPQEGIVISVGPGKKDEPMNVQKGDRVLFGKYAGTEFNIEDETYVIMKETEIFATIE